MFSIAEIKVTTTNNESFMIELDNHRTLYWCWNTIMVKYTHKVKIVLE
jgi:hypothetical protein